MDRHRGLVPCRHHGIHSRLVAFPASSCKPSAVVVLILQVGYVVLLFANNPFRRPIDRFFMIPAACLSAVMALCIVFGRFGVGSHSAALQFATYTATVLTLLAAVKVIYDVAAMAIEKFRKRGASHGDGNSTDQQLLEPTKADESEAFRDQSGSTTEPAAGASH